MMMAPLSEDLHIPLRIRVLAVSAAELDVELQDRPDAYPFMIGENAYISMSSSSACRYP